RVSEGYQALRSIECPCVTHLNPKLPFEALTLLHVRLQRVLLALGPGAGEYPRTLLAGAAAGLGLGRRHLISAFRFHAGLYGTDHVVGQALLLAGYEDGLEVELDLADHAAG